MGKRQTGFPPEVRQLVYTRSGQRCEICGHAVSDVELHHRRPRGMGGTLRPETNDASNALACCGDCHRFVESHRTEALEKGWLIRQSGDPCMTPVLYRGVVWVVLDNDGYMYRTRKPENGVAS